MELAVASCTAERLAAKSVCAADIFQNVMSLANELEVLNKRLTRYVKQIQLLLTWRRGTAALKMAGSAAKTVASVMVLAAPLHPKLRVALCVGQKLWTLGASLKILNIFSNIIRDLWQNGCRKCLLEFAHTAATLTRNIGVFGEVIRDLQKTPQIRNSEANLETPRQLFNIVKEFIPQAQHVYVAHVSSMIFGADRYSPLFDFASLVSDPANQSLSMQLIRELESLNFVEFTQESDSRSLVVVSSLLHISRELLDFLDGYHQFTEKDCTFLHDCLLKLTYESTSILKVVTFLVSLSKTNSRKIPMESDTSILNTPRQVPKEDEAVEKKIVEESASDNGVDCDQSGECLVIDESKSDTTMEVDAKNKCLPVEPSQNIQENDPHESRDKISNNETGPESAKAPILTQTMSALSNLMKRSSSALLSSKRKKLKEETTQFGEGADQTRL